MECPFYSATFWRDVTETAKKMLRYNFVQALVHQYDYID